MEDKWLILRFKRGSTEALCRIYEKYERAMLAVALGLLNDHSAAQDVVHDVFSPEWGAAVASQSVDKPVRLGTLAGSGLSQRFAGIWN